MSGCGDDAKPAASDEDAGDTDTPPPANPTPTNPNPPTLITDAATDGPTTLTSNPGKVSCGATDCTIGQAAPACCWANNAPAGATCGTCDGANIFAFTCDEPADCTAELGGAKCCFDFGSTSCGDDCHDADHAGVELCKTNADCDQGATCVLKSCTRQNEQSQNITFSLHVCSNDPVDCN